MNEELVIFNKPKSNISEDIRTIRTNLKFTSTDKESKVILVTSAIPGEGKSFISSNLGAAFAKTEELTLIIDSDLRLGRIHKIFGVSNKTGLSNLLVEEDLSKIPYYVKKTEISNLYVIPRGTVPPNPSELLNSKKNSRLIEILKKKFDIVILDSAPLTGLSDSLILSSLVDKVLIVSSVNHTPKTELINAKKALENVGANVAGIVINNVVGRRGSYGGYYYYYGYCTKITFRPI